MRRRSGSGVGSRTERSRHGQMLARVFVLVVAAVLIVGRQTSADNPRAGASPLVHGSTPDSRAVPAATRHDPLAGRPFFVVPENSATRASAALPQAAAALDVIARQPTAMWITETTGLAQVSRLSQLAAAEHALPTFVLYAIPHRDCGSFSAGGYTTAAQYEAFVGRVVVALGGRPAAVVVEPDALPELADCGLTAARQQQRVGLIRDAVSRLAAAGLTVYLEAGGRYSHPAATMAPILAAAGLAHAAGFALDVSGFDSTASETSYGLALSALTGGSHFVIDTSRNGNGIPPGTPRGAFCNVPGLGLGPVPTTATGNPLVDAYLWVKYPGESDGACGDGAPHSGVFWPAYALALVARTPA